MKISIKRFDGINNSKIENFIVNDSNALKALNEIKQNQDSSLSFRCGCRSGVCGSCAIRVNGIERLACKTTISENDLIEPIKNLPIIKDLVVDVSRETLLIKQTKSSINNYSNENIKNEDIEKIDLQSNCILCSSCYSSCPVYEVNLDFLGPYALTRALRYVEDKKESNKSLILDSIQKSAIWDCTLCSACTLVCPQGIDPKSDILKLQNISVQNGYNNPHLENFNMGFDSGFDTGFDPNGF